MSTLTELHQVRASIRQILGTLDEPAQATRDHDRDAYTIARDLARTHQLSDEQIRDAHDWGNRTAHSWARFDWRGTIRHV